MRLLWRLLRAVAICLVVAVRKGSPTNKEHRDAHYVVRIISSEQFSKSCSSDVVFIFWTSIMLFLGGTNNIIFYMQD